MRSLKAFDDPRLDRAFTQAYYAAMHEVERTERTRAVKDSADAFAAMFAQELEGRDLLPEERRRFVGALRDSIGTFQAQAARRGLRRRRFALAGGGVFTVVGLLVLLGYLAAARPFASVPAIESELATYRERVQEGYGEYAKRYYRVLDRFERRLGTARVTEHQAAMHGVLDDHFRVLLERVDNGEIAYVDDAYRWSGYYPEREERAGRRSQVQNTLVNAVGQKIGESMDTVIQGARDFLDRAIGDLEAEDPPPEPAAGETATETREP